MRTLKNIIYLGMKELRSPDESPNDFYQNH